MLLALTSASGAPGVSTTALALALHRKPDYTLLVEGDPVGSSPTMAGYLRSEINRRTSLKNLIEGDRLGHLYDAVAAEAIQLPDSRVKLLPGLVHAGQSTAMERTWPHLAEQLSYFAPEYTVVVDGGRMSTAPMEVMRRADVIGIVVRPTLPCIAALQSALVPFTQALTAHRSQARVGLIVIGEFGQKWAFRGHQYDADEIAKAVGMEVILPLPYDAAAARMYSEGIPLSKWRQRRSMYMLTLHHSWPIIEKFRSRKRPWTDPGVDIDPTTLASVGGGAR
ncbi:hypothetical protein AB0N05_37745 [Nocardia sp. NPDC051030]|uniref:hypothetical protein n=1 Tax=Nocardia sp. NPDC051030 TaxID=3155162 RepID=UPI00341490FD